jgi:hypothetical protein
MMITNVIVSQTIVIIVVNVKKIVLAAAEIASSYI